MILGEWVFLMSKVPLYLLLLVATLELVPAEVLAHVHLAQTENFAMPWW